MSEENAINVRILYGIGWFLSGAALLCLLTTFQNIFQGIPLTLKSYIVPFWFGGISALAIGLWEMKLRDSGRKLQESENRFRNLYQKTPVMLHSIDRTGRIFSVSDHWLEVLGYEREEVIGKKLSDFLSLQSRRYARETVLPEFFRAGFVKDIPYQMVKKTGEIIHVLVSATAERDRNGECGNSQTVIIDVTERRRAEKEIQKLAYYDTLTGLPNRILFQDRLRQALAQAHRERKQVGILFLDLDRFKAINDSLGHAAGDMLLKLVARRLQGCIRESDTVARLGGDEFVVVLSGIHNQDDLIASAQKILETLSRPVRLAEKELFSTASIGISMYPNDADNVDSLLKNADVAMYAAKEKGRNTYQFFSEEMNVQVVEKLGLETRLRLALKRDEFYLAYQPQLNLQTGKITGLEALLRWRHPDAGQVPPLAFIRVAEETGLILAIGEWVLRTACIQAKAWQDAGFPSVRLAVNISGRQFVQPDFIDMIDTILKQTGFDPNLLELELTESIVMENVPDTIMTLTDLKVRGVRLAIDDFGTGYSSLSYLKHFPFDRIKIAQEFVRDITVDPEDAAIVQAITGIAETLGLEVIAEGVEKKEQLDFLRLNRCAEMQGFYFARPMPAEAMTGLFQKSMAGEGVNLLH